MEKERTREKNSNLEEFSADHHQFSHGIAHTQQHCGERFYKMFCLLFFILFFILVYNNSSLKNHFLEFLLSRAFGLQFFFFLLSLAFIFQYHLLAFCSTFPSLLNSFFSWFLLWHLFENDMLLRVGCMNFIHVSLSLFLLCSIESVRFSTKDL